MSGYWPEPVNIADFPRFDDLVLIAVRYSDEPVRPTEIADSLERRYSSGRATVAAITRALIRLERRARVERISPASAYWRER